MRIPYILAEASETSYDCNESVIRLEKGLGAIAVLHELAHWLHHQLDPTVYDCMDPAAGGWADDFFELVATYVAVYSAQEWLSEKEFEQALNHRTLPDNWYESTHLLDEQTHVYAESLLVRFLDMYVVRHLFDYCMSKV